MSPELSTSIATWIYTVLTLGIAIAAFKTYHVARNDYKVKNSFEAISMYNNLLDEPHHNKNLLAINLPKTKRGLLNQMFRCNSDSSGVAAGHMWDMSENNIALPITAFFSEGAPDSGLISELLDCFELVSKLLLSNRLDETLILYEMGQHMFFIHNKLHRFSEIAPAKPELEAHKNFHKEAWPSFYKYMEKIEGKYLSSPIKRHYTI